MTADDEPRSRHSGARSADRPVAPATLQELLDRTSLASPGARALRERMPVGAARALVYRAEAVTAGSTPLGCGSVRRAGSIAGSLAPRLDQQEHRKFLARIAAILFGVSKVHIRRGGTLPVPSPTARHYMAVLDVTELESKVHQLRRADQFNAPLDYDAVVTLLPAGFRLLHHAGSESVRRRLCRVLAQLCMLAGWSAFEVDLTDLVFLHYEDAFVLAQEADSPFLLTQALYQVGRCYLEYDEPGYALKPFQLGQIVAQDSELSPMIAILCANEAWAYAKLGNVEETHKMIARAQEEFARTNLATLTVFLRALEPQTWQAPALPALAGPSQEQRPTNRMTVDRPEPGIPDLVAVAVIYLQTGEVENGVREARHALALASTTTTPDITAHVQRLKAVADELDHHPTARELSREIEATLQRAS